MLIVVNADNIGGVSLRSGETIAATWIGEPAGTPGAEGVQGPESTPPTSVHAGIGQRSEGCRSQPRERVSAGSVAAGCPLDLLYGGLECQPEGGTSAGELRDCDSRSNMGTQESSRSAPSAPASAEPKEHMPSPDNFVR